MFATLASFLWGSTPAKEDEEDTEPEKTPEELTSSLSPTDEGTADESTSSRMETDSDDMLDVEIKNVPHIEKIARHNGEICRRFICTSCTMNPGEVHTCFLQEVHDIRMPRETMASSDEEAGWVFVDSFEPKRSPPKVEKTFPAESKVDTQHITIRHPTPPPCDFNRSPKPKQKSDKKEKALISTDRKRLKEFLLERQKAANNRILKEFIERSSAQRFCFNDPRYRKQPRPCRHMRAQKALKAPPKEPLEEGTPLGEPLKSKTPSPPPLPPPAPVPNHMVPLPAALAVQKDLRSQQKAVRAHQEHRLKRSHLEKANKVNCVHNSSNRPAPRRRCYTPQVYSRVSNNRKC